MPGLATSARPTLALPLPPLAGGLFFGRPTLLRFAVEFLALPFQGAFERRLFRLTRTGPFARRSARRVAHVLFRVRGVTGLTLGLIHPPQLLVRGLFQTSVDLFR